MTTISDPSRGGAISRIVRTFREHPVLSGGVVLTGLMAAALALNSLTKPAVQDRNPAYSRINTGQATLETYNREDQLVWQKPIHPSYSYMIWPDASLVEVGDIDGDGRNEVVTVLPFASDTFQGYPPAILRVLDGDKAPRLEKRLGEQAAFNGRWYGSDYSCIGLLLFQVPSTQKKEIILNLAGFRSPSVIARINSDDKTLGEFWHFGRIGIVQKVRIDGYSQELLLLGGLNDVRDSVLQGFASVIVLDPAKLKGKVESSASRGFGLPCSEAEIFYLRLPEPDITASLKTTNSASRLFVDSTSIRIVSRTGYTGEREFQYLPQFEFVFNHQMVPIEVKSLSGDDAFYARLRERGKTKSRIDARYLEDLKKAIRYWDGVNWRSEVVRVGSTVPRDSVVALSR